MLNRDYIEDEEESLRLQVRNLPDEKRSKFYNQFEKEIKDPDTYAVLNYLFITGLHHFYLKKWLRGFISLSVFIIGVIVIFSGYIEAGLIIIVIMSLIEVYELFFSQLIIQDYNNKITKKIIKKL